MKLKILILTLMMAFVFGNVACAQEIKYAIIKIPTDPEEYKKTDWEDPSNIIGFQVYFLDKDGKRHDVKWEPIKEWPPQVNPDYIKAGRLFIDHAMWHISNPTCINWDSRRK